MKIIIVRKVCGSKEAETFITVLYEVAVPQFVVLRLRLWSELWGSNSFCNTNLTETQITVIMKFLFAIIAEDVTCIWKQVNLIWFINAGIFRIFPQQISEISRKYEGPSEIIYLCHVHLHPRYLSYEKTGVRHDFKSRMMATSWGKDPFLGLVT